MALIVKDRVLETCSTSGLVDFTLTGAVTGYQRFSTIGNGNTTYYAAYVIGSNDWEVGIGTVGTSSLTRDTILSSSTGSKVNFAGNPVVWCDLPSSKAIFGDANNNISVNSIFEGFTSVGASGTQIVLTASSTPYYLVTGSGGQTIKLPDATTLPVGAVFDFNNNQSSGAITVNNNSNTLVASIPSGGYTSVILTNNSTAAGSWDRHDQAPSNVSWSTNTFDYPGSITSATWNGSTVAVNRGGTGQTTFTAGQIVYGNGTSALATSSNMTFDGTKLTLANDASVSGLTIGKGAGSIATNTVVGNAALGSNVSGASLVAIGQQALRVNTASNNTAVGYQAGYSNTTGANNFFGGYVAGFNNTTGYGNVAIGGSDNAVGSALYFNTDGYQLTAIGAGALAKNTTGIRSTAVGFQSLNANTTASNNTAIGYQAGSTLTTGSNNILIGYQAAPSAITVSNEITIGNSTNTVIRYPHSYGTVASLPSASTVGRGSRTFVTDALAPVFQATVTGGGAVFTPVYSDGTNWKIG
jgi:hypothetical protein